MRRIRLAGPAVILLAAAAATAPQLLRGNSCGHDFDFHLVSWLDCLHSWRHGILYPHWSPSSNYGAGEPRFIFYPPLTWILGAALGLILPWPLAPIALTFLLLAATGLATRALARQAFSDAPATMAGCAALFSGYSLFTAYERSAFGELTGGFWIPLLLLFTLRDRNPSASLLRRALDGSAVPLALVVAGSWLSNLPLGVMASYLLAAVALAAALLARSWAPVLRASAATVLGMSLAAIYMLPSAWEQRWVNIQQAASDPGEMIENSWLFARHADPLLELHDLELRRISMIAAAMIAVALAGLLLSRLRNTLPAKLCWWFPLALIPQVVLFLQLHISLPVWNLLPKLRFLQFPWRWLVVLEAPMAIFFASAVWPSQTARRWRRFAVAAVCAVVFLGASAVAVNLFFQVCDDEDNVLAMASVYRAGTGFQGTGEYSPIGADNSMIAVGLPAACLVDDPSTELGQGAQEDVNPVWSPRQHSCEATFAAATNLPQHLRIPAVAPHAGFLILRLRNYPAWQVKVNGQPVAGLPQRDDGLMAVPVPQGAVDLTVDWTTTPDVLAGRWLSALAVLLLTGLWFLERRLTGPHLS
ncbi:MAG: 6-pyruvoyl-tetrahydropterin synthase-related protein [Terracidiphilus sp.]